jgi:hypothetical protein
LAAQPVRRGGMHIGEEDAGKQRMEEGKSGRNEK